MTLPRPRSAAHFDYDPARTPLEGPTDLPCGHWVHIRAEERQGWDLQTRTWQPCPLKERLKLIG